LHSMAERTETGALLLLFIRGGDRYALFLPKGRTTEKNDRRSHGGRMVWGDRPGGKGRHVFTSSSRKREGGVQFCARTKNIHSRRQKEEKRAPDGRYISYHQEKIDERDGRRGALRIFCVGGGKKGRR